MADTLNPDQSLSIDQSLTSHNELFTLILQGDGNLVLYEPGGPVWASDTWGNPVSQAVMQGDGNFVIYGPSGALWATGTDGNPGARLVVQDDRNVVIYGANGVALWASNTWVTVWIPGDGTLVREQSNPKVYVVYSGTKFWIPTPDALLIMGHSWSDVSLVPDGALAGLPETGIDSTSPTPGSLVFPPPNDPNGPDQGRHFAVTGVNTSIRVVSQGREVRVIELRGWLYPVPPEFVINVEGGWDDWHYELEVDSAWAVEQGIDLNQILKIGNILEHGLDKGSLDSFRKAALPRIGLEINGWKPGNNRGVPKPSDWVFPDVGTTQGQEFVESVGLPATRWPYDPRLPFPGGPDDEGAAQYARVVGCLIADKPHTGGERGAALAAWRGGARHEAEANPARSTEIHPPDRIQLLPNRPRSETLCGVAVVAANGPLDAAEQAIDVRIAPPGPRPSLSHRVGVVELVGPETNFSTIMEGNASKNGARITKMADEVRVYVKVARTGLWGAPGKFKALYRVFWEPGPPAPPELWVSVSPHPVPVGTPVAVTVHAVDSQTGAPIAGTARIQNPDQAAQEFPTNAPFTFTFQTHTVRRRDPDGLWEIEIVPPTGSVTAPGYPESVRIDFGV